MLTPDYVAVEKGGRLLIGREPYGRKHERMFIGWVLVLAVPALLGLMWVLSDRPDRDGLFWLAPPVVVVGVGLLIHTAVTTYVIDDRSAEVVADPAAGVVLVKGRPLCPASAVALVAMQRVSGRRWGLHELLLVLRPALAEPGSDSRSVVMGLADDIEVPGRQLATALGVPFRRL